MNKPSIAIDLDSVLNNLEQVWLDAYNQDYDDNLTVEDMVAWDLTEYIKPKCGNKIYDYILQPMFFLSLNIKPNAYEVTKWLSQYADLYIVTAYTYTTCYDKVEWVKKYLPHIDIRNIIFCNDKSKIDMDFLIDDRDLNITTFKGKGIVFDMPYNRHLNNIYPRVHNWLEIKDYFIKEFKL